MTSELSGRGATCPHTGSWELRQGSVTPMMSSGHGPLVIGAGNIRAPHTQSHNPHPFQPLTAQLLSSVTTGQGPPAAQPPHKPCAHARMLPWCAEEPLVSSASEGTRVAAVTLGRRRPTTRQRASCWPLRELLKSGWDSCRNVLSPLPNCNSGEAGTCLTLLRTRARRSLSTSICKITNTGGAPGWLSWLRVQLLVSAQGMISGL